VAVQANKIFLLLTENKMFDELKEEVVTPAEETPTEATPEVVEEPAT